MPLHCVWDPDDAAFAYIWVGGYCLFYGAGAETVGGYVYDVVCAGHYVDITYIQESEFQAMAQMLIKYGSEKLLTIIIDHTCVAGINEFSIESLEVPSVVAFFVLP